MCMPHLEDTLEGANDCAADCAAAEATCCVPARGAAGSAATTGEQFDTDQML